MTEDSPSYSGEGRTGGSSDTIRRKNLNIDQAKLDRVKEVLGASTETEAVDRALDMILLREELVEGIRRIAGTGGVEEVYADEDEGVA
ncbi:MAG: hypothetical protein ACOC8B_05025 [Gemmatimonadota bacterium]